MGAKRRTNELKISRVFDAPVDAVWDAWTDPEQVARWWGPRGFTITTHSKDLRPGGTWVYTMHGPDGTDYPNITTYHVVREREALVYDHGATANTPPLFRVSVAFSAHGERTAMEMTMTLESPEKAAEIAKFIKRAGGESTWDRLAEYVSGQDVFVLNRSIDAPMERVQAMWTVPQSLTHWLPPAGLRMEVLQGAVAAGENLFGRMFGPDFEFYFRFEYREVGPNRLVYTQQFCNRDGVVSRHPGAPGWPETLLTTVLFTPEGPERTRVTVRCEPCGAPAEEAALFIAERAGMTKGWSGSFDKLEELLAAENGRLLGEELRAWREWSRTADQNEPGWGTDAPNWAAILRLAADVLLQPVVPAPELSLLEEVFAISEEGECLADVLKEHYQSVAAETVQSLAASANPAVRWQVYDSVTGPAPAALALLEQGLSDADAYVRRRALLRKAALAEDEAVRQVANEALARSQNEPRFPSAD